MKDEEKKLIENLFDRLKKTELNSSERDKSADDLIQKLVQKQPASSYYMAQTILIQETAIKKMSTKIDELKEKIKTLNVEESNKKPSFLSGFFKKNPVSQASSHDDKVWQKKENILRNNYSNSTVSPIHQTLPVTNSSGRTSGFLSSALQTATGVAGGMILGNMLMNVFNHAKPEEEVFDTVNNSSLDQHTDENFFNDHTVTNNDLMTDNNLINYEHSRLGSESDSENMNCDFDSTDDITDISDFDSNDDNFI